MQFAPVAYQEITSNLISAHSTSTPIKIFAFRNVSIYQSYKKLTERYQIKNTSAKELMQSALNYSDYSHVSPKPSQQCFLLTANLFTLV